MDSMFDTDTYKAERLVTLARRALREEMNDGELSNWVKAALPLGGETAYERPERNTLPTRKVGALGKDCRVSSRNRFRVVELIIEREKQAKRSLEGLSVYWMPIMKSPKAVESVCKHPGSGPPQTSTRPYLHRRG
ncbi:hypothetical protein HHI36_009743 [Cryptolaemus montrouzieri]|uniref:Uncharacterized protein n=1 Tax=Cryptolaemus montrouzieri TaxID=559131 RepID=A0ABD2MGR0_9CUCU